MKPDMFVNVEFGIAGAKQLVVPAEAVLDTGDRQTVFVDLGDGYLEPRQVVVGERFGDRVAITRGLTAGERVVSSGTFLIDSESQLKAAAGGMGAPQHQHGGAATAAANADRTPAADDASAAERTAMINALIELSAKNRFVVFLLVAVATVAGVWSMKTVPLDAIPDLSDTQVIVYSRWDRSPDIVEDQVTYPIVTAMLGAPKVKAVRGFSDFGFSYVYIVFEEGTDIYWARSRTLEYLSGVLPRLPQGVRTELGPDATGVGWVFQYALVDTTGRHEPGRAAQLPGLVPALLPEGGARRRRGRAARRLRAAVPGPGRSRIACATFNIADRARCIEAVRGGQQRRRRTARRDDRRRVHGARPRLREVGRRYRRDRARAQRRRRARARARRRRRSRSAPTCAAASPT